MPCAAHRLACVLHAVGRAVECLEAESQSALSLWSCVCRAAGGADSRHNTQTRKKRRERRSNARTEALNPRGGNGRLVHLGKLLMCTRRVCGLHGHGRQTPPKKHQEESARGEEGGGGGAAFGDERRVKLWNAPQWAIMNFIRDSSSGRNKKDGFV